MSKWVWRIVLLCPLLMTGCQLSQLGYQSTLQQGYPISDQQMAQLKVGQTKMKVEDILGSPTLTHPGNDNEWVYVNITENKVVQEKELLHLTFKGKLLQSIEHPKHS